MVRRLYLAFFLSFRRFQHFPPSLLLPFRVWFGLTITDETLTVFFSSKRSNLGYHRLRHPFHLCLFGSHEDDPVESNRVCADR